MKFEIAALEVANLIKDNSQEPDSLFYTTCRNVGEKACFCLQKYEDDF